VNRRAFVTGLGAMLAAPRAGEAQQPTKRTATVGVLAITAATPGSARILEAFKQSLRESGWVEGGGVRFEMRWSEGRPERFSELAAELVQLKVDVIHCRRSLVSEQWPKTGRS